MANYDWKGDVFVFENPKGRLELPRTEIAESIQQFLWEYGVKVWASRYAAKAANGTDQEYLDTMKEAFARLRNGEVRLKGRGIDDSLILEAYLILAKTKVKGKAAEELANRWMETFKGLSEDERKRVLNKDNVRLAITEAKASRRIRNATVTDDFDPNV